MTLIQVFSCEFGKILKNIFLQNTSECLLLHFWRAPYSKVASNAIAKYCQIDWRIERLKTLGSIYFLQRLDLTRIKLLVGNSAIIEVDELKITLQYLDLYLRFFECKFKHFHIYNFKSKKQN